MGLFQKLLGWGKEQHTQWFSIDKGNSYQFNRITKDEPIKAYLGNDAIYSIVHKIALNGSTLPYKVYKGDKEIYDSYYDLLEAPNEKESRQEFMYKAFTNFSLTGDLFITKEKTSIGFALDKMQVLPSQSVKVNRYVDNDFFSEVKNYEVNLGGVTKTYEVEEIIHLKYHDPSIEGQLQNNGLSPLQSGQYILEANNNLTVAESSLLNNRGANNLISGADAQYGLTPQEKEDLDRTLKSRIGGAKKFNSAVVVSNEVKVHKLDMSPNDLRLIESYPNQLKRLCTLFSVPAELFNAEGSGQYNTRKEALKSFYSEGVIPVAQLIYSAIDRGLAQGYTQEVDKKGIDALNPSREEKQNTLLAMFTQGAISRETFLELSEIKDNGKTFVKSTTNGQRSNQEA